uniref:ubiquitin carboxyl-terminal hydrolase 40-like isoform X8 n=1 Tax=Pristiophorus japonicus TaxID=55135 RepID=UPI00398ED71C
MWLVIKVKRVARLLFPVVLFGRCYWYDLFYVFQKMCAIVTKRSIGAVNRMGNKPGKVFVGLINQGATCYLNTLLQTWFMTPEVKCHIGSLKSDMIFVLELQSLYEKLESSEEMFLGTNALTSSLSLNVFKQCDIEECFRDLINKLNVEVDQGHKILKLYQITMVQSVKCSGCTNLVEDDCFFLDIPLPIRSDTSSENFGHLETALQEFLKEDTMEGDHKCYCDHCRTKTKTKIRYYFKHLPQILTFQLKRFEVVGNWMYNQKCHDCIIIPLALEFNKNQIKDNCSEWCLKPTMDKSLDSGQGRCHGSQHRLESLRSQVSCSKRRILDEHHTDQSQQDSTEETEYNAHRNHQSQNIGRGQPSIQVLALQEEDPGEADRTVGDDAVIRPVAAQDQSQQDSTEETVKEEEEIERGPVPFYFCPNNPELFMEYNALNNHQSQNIGRGHPSIQALVLQEEVPGEADRTVRDDAVIRPVAAQDQSQQDSTEETVKEEEEIESGLVPFYFCLNNPEWFMENNAHNNHQSRAIGRGHPLIQNLAIQEEGPGKADRTVGDDAMRKPVAAQDQSQQDSTEETERKYELFAIWHHSEEYGSGHYYAEIKSVDDGNWYCFNDKIVEKKKKQVSLSSKTAYLIMYRKIDKNNTAGPPSYR